MLLEMMTLESASDTEWMERRLQAKTKVMTDIIGDFLYADDYTLNAESEADMPRSVDKFSDASAKP